MIALDQSSFMSFLYKEASQFQIHFSQSLSILSSSSPPKTPLKHSKLPPHPIFDLKIIFLHLVCWFLPLSHAFHIFQPNFWDFFYKLWGFSKLMKFFCNFCDGCCFNKFKTSCIASHMHYNNVSCILYVCLLCCYVVCW